jgi:xylulokinase
MERSVLAVDIGTSSMKGGLLSQEGSLIARARIPLVQHTPCEHGLWRAELWEEAFIELMGQLFPGGAFTAHAICISGHGPSVVPMTTDGSCAGGALLWHDRRDKRIGGEPSFFLPKMAWYRENAPEIWDRTTSFLGCPEYLAFRLTGDALFYTPSRHFIPHLWTEEGAARYNIPLGLLPPPVKTGEPAGVVSSAGSERFGIPAGIPVAAGGSDFLMALLGSGVVRPGMTCDRAGTSEGINFCSKEMVKHPRVRTLPHAVEGLYNVAGILSSTGLVFEWFRRLTGQEGREYESMLREIRDAAFLPGPLFFPSLHRGAVWEFSGALFSGLQPRHGPVELGVAVVSAIGFGIRDCIEGLLASGCAPAVMRVCGGQGRSRIWNCMKSDITGLPLEIPENLDCELTGDGAAAFAMLDGAGAAGLLDQSLRLPEIKEQIEPDPVKGARWDELYHYYCEERNKILGC